jgi:hypothetical protein
MKKFCLQIKTIVLMAFLSLNSGMTASELLFKNDSDSYSVIKAITVDGLKVVHYRVRNASYCALNYEDRLYLLGPIDTDSTFVVKKLLDELEPCKLEDGKTAAPRVGLNSVGGLVVEGFELGKILRKKGAYTEIYSGDSCSSSCAIAFLGGIYRSVSENAKISFHTPYKLVDNPNIFNPLTGEYGKKISCLTADTLDLQNYFTQMLGPENGSIIYERTMNHCSAGHGWTVEGSDTAVLYGIANIRADGSLVDEINISEKTAAIDDINESNLVQVQDIEIFRNPMFWIAQVIDWTPRIAYF